MWSVNPMAIAGVRGRSRRPSGRPSPASRKARCGPQPVVLKPAQDPPRIPGLYRLGKGRGLACPRVQPVLQHAVPSFLMHRIGTIHPLSQNPTDLRAHDPAPMTALNGLRQPHPRRGRQGRTPPLSRRLRIPIDPTNRPSIDRPPITDPDHPPPAGCARAGVRHPLRRDLILRRPKAPRHPKTSGAILTPTSPTRAHPARRGGRISSLRRLFWTKDPKASTSTSLQCRSWTSTWGMVSSLWPVISSAALRPPRRIPTRRGRASDPSPCPG